MLPLYGQYHVPTANICQLTADSCKIILRSARMTLQHGLTPLDRSVIGSTSVIPPMVPSNLPRFLSQLEICLLGRTYVVY